MKMMGCFCRVFALLGVFFFLCVFFGVGLPPKKDNNKQQQPQVLNEQLKMMGMKHAAQESEKRRLQGVFLCKVLHFCWDLKTNSPGTHKTWVERVTRRGCGPTSTAFPSFGEECCARRRPARLRAASCARAGGVSVVFFFERQREQPLFSFLSVGGFSEQRY